MSLKFYETDPRGGPDPRDGQEYETLHPRTNADIARAKYDDDNPPDNGNRRRHSDADNKGSLSNDLQDGRGGQDWKGW